jgi:hypothetical protein
MTDMIDRAFSDPVTWLKDFPLRKKLVIPSVGKMMWSGGPFAWIRVLSVSELTTIHSFGG